jgi:hypothetical protein
MILSKKEWAKKYVIRWQGIKNCDTHTVEGGYLFVRNDDGSITGLGGRGVRSRAEAIAQNYDLYVKAQANTGLQPTAQAEPVVSAFSSAAKA